MDCLVIATVSNWGAYGIVRAMDKCTGRSLLPGFKHMDDFYRFIVERGSVDGTTGRRELSVDGFGCRPRELRPHRSIGTMPTGANVSSSIPINVASQLGDTG